VLVEDVAEALLRCADAPGIEGKSFNLAGPPLLSAREYLAALERASGVRVRWRSASPLELYLGDTAKWLVRSLARLPGRPRPRLAVARALTAAAPMPCRNARTLLGWTPCADRDRLIEEGVRAPVVEFLG
jgi:nucleoside-diphosphate-sugar epimerase